MLIPTTGLEVSNNQDDVDWVLSILGKVDLA